MLNYLGVVFDNLAYWSKYLIKNIPKLDTGIKIVVKYIILCIKYLIV